MVMSEKNCINAQFAVDTESAEKETRALSCEN